MRKAVAVFGFAALMVLASFTAAPAIAIFSADGAGDGFGVLTCTTGGCPGVFEIATFSAWKNPALSPQPSAEWVSFAANHGAFNNGVPDGTTTTFRYTFTAAVASFLNLSIWADDTTGVVLDGVTSLFAPNPGPLYPLCAPSPIGCTAGNEGIISGLPISAGLHTIDFAYSQLGGSGSPTGVMMAGELTAVPEPATILLLGSALAAAGVVSRRRFKKSETKV